MPRSQQSADYKVLHLHIFVVITVRTSVLQSFPLNRMMNLRLNWKNHMNILCIKHIK